MPAPKSKLETEILNLDIRTRAQLAGKLLMSLDNPSASEVEQLWLNEAEKRLEEYRSGTSRGIPANEVFQRVLTELS